MTRLLAWLNRRLAAWNTRLEDKQGREAMRLHRELEIYQGQQNRRHRS